MKFTNLTSEQKLEAFKALVDNGTIRNGQYINVSFKSVKKALKAYEKEYGPTLIEKISKGVVRMGINYYNTETYKQKVLTDQPIVSHPSPYDSPVEGYEHLLIETNKDGKISYKVRIFSSKTDTPMVSEWRINGELTTEKDLEGIMCKQSKPNPSEFITFTIMLDNLISIGE